MTYISNKSIFGDENSWLFMCSYFKPISTAIICTDKSQIMLAFANNAGIFNATNNHLKKKCLFSLSFICARCPSLFHTDLFSAIVGKMGSSAGFSVVYVYTAELFPTQVHNLSFFFLFCNLFRYFIFYIVKYMTKPLLT